MKILKSILMGALFLGFIPVNAQEALPEMQTEETAEEKTEAESGYVLMNIPYDAFYAEESDNEVDAVSSATLNKPRTGTLAGGSYHVNSDGSDITGVIYPVYVEDMNVLKTNGYTQITDESSVTITVRNRGKETTTEYVGKDALFESASYSYYVLSEEPEYYKTADFSGEVPAFSSINKEARTVEGAEGSVTYNARHADIEIKLSLPEGIEQGQKVSGVVVTADGQKYGLRHIANIWRATEIGWNMDENDIYGKTITNIRYITENDVIDYPVEIKVMESGYVLMNIPYDAFYAEESDNEVDAVSSATLNKPRTGTLAGGSYHVNSDGSDITGVIYPVYVEDMNVLKTNGYTQITDESSVTITVRNRGKETTTEYVGKDALFESASYSYYVLSEEPEYYKTADFSGEVPAFSSINKEARTVEGAEGSVTYNARHADIEIKLSLPEGIEQGQKVSGVVVTADGQKYGLRHIANIWRATEIGWDMDENDIYGKTITNIRYITENDVIDYPVSILVKQIEVTAEAAGAKQVKISGLPEDTANAKASVSYTEASDETASMFFMTVHADEIIFIAENADVTDGIVDVNEEMVDGRTYDVTAVSDNYSILPTSFVYHVDLAEIENDQKTAGSLKEADYTPESWKKLQEALKNAEDVLSEEKLTQSMVDEAEEKLADAINALKKVKKSTPEKSTPDTSDHTNGSGWIIALGISVLAAIAALKLRLTH